MRPSSRRSTGLLPAVEKRFSDTLRSHLAAAPVAAYFASRIERALLPIADHWLASPSYRREEYSEHPVDPEIEEVVSVISSEEELTDSESDVDDFGRPLRRLSVPWTRLFPGPHFRLAHSIGHRLNPDTLTPHLDTCPGDFQKAAYLFNCRLVRLDHPGRNAYPLYSPPS